MHAAVALTTAIASPALAKIQKFAASLGIPAEVAQNLTLAEIAQFKVAPEGNDNHIETYAGYGGNIGKNLLKIYYRFVHT